MRENEIKRITPWGLSYVLERKRVKNINMRMRPGGELYVSAPPRTTIAFIEEVLLQRREWIESAYQRSLAREKEKAPEMSKSEETELRRRAQVLFHRSIEKMYACLPKGSAPYPELKIRKMTSRWGSCMPGKKTITLNLFLALLPEECLDYVALHELCHFLHANHSPRFYAAVASVMPDWQRRRQKLREYEYLLRKG